MQFKVVPYSENCLVFMFNGGSSSSSTICPIAEYECPTICQTAKIVSTKLLLQTLYGTTLKQ